MSILIIEDEKKIAEILRKALISDRHGAEIAYDGEEGFKKAMSGNYALIILDLMLPKKDGVEICRELRAKGIQTPIIMLTARGTADDRVLGLDLGADDYIVKPFGIDELLARVRAVLRRRKTVDSPVFKIADLVLDTKRHEVTRAGKPIVLTPKEYRLLAALLRSDGQVLTRRQLIDSAWGPTFTESNNELNVHIRYLRRKIDTNGLKPLIKTIRGAGYSIKD
ncbi:MAG TPA: response regulator transcription factor [Candidatus Paceibacterota bacterium]